jgi:hypothetical protein
MGVNMADQKVWINNGTSVVQIGSGKLSGLADVVLSSLATGQGLSWNGTNWVNSSAGAGSVTSVSGTGTVSGLTLTGSVTSSGSLTLGGTLSLTSGQVTTALGFTPANATQLTAGVTQTNFDAIKAPGLYQYDGTMTSTPNGRANYRAIEIGSNGRYSQIALPWDQDGMWFRRHQDSTWGTWREVLHSGNFSSYAPSLSSTYADPAWITSLASSKLTGTIDNARLNGGTYTINVTGNAGTATALQTARTINGVSFNGTANITVADSTKLPLTGGTVSGAITSSLAPAAINTTTPGLVNYGFVFNGASSSDSAQSLTWTWTNGGGAQAGIYVQSSGNYGTKMYLATTDSFATGAKTAISIDHTGAVSVLRSGLTAAAGVVSGGNNGFANATWFSGVRNPIWYFGNSTSYGISYFQGASGIGGADTIGIHPNGTPTSGGSAFSVTPSASYVNSNVVLHAGNYTSYLNNSYMRAIGFASSSNDWNGLGNSYPNSVEQVDPSNFSSTANGPTTASYTYGTLINFSSQSSSQAQIYISHAGNDLIFRGGWNGASWQTWNKVLTNQNYTSYSPSLTGSGASGTWSINVTGNAGTATTLQTSRTINGIPFNGSAAIDTTEWFHSDRDFPNGTLITTNINYAVTNGDPFVLEIRGNSYGNIVPLDLLYQGYIYADTIINHGGISNGLNISGLVAINNGGNLCFWFPSQGYWNGYNVKVYSAYATRATNRVTSITGVGKPTTAKEVALSANIRQSIHSGNVSSYALSASGGTINGNGTLDFGPNSSWGATLRIGGNGHTGATRASVVTTNGNLHLDGTSSRGVYLNWYNASTEGTFFGNGAGGQVGRVDGGGNATFSGNVSGASDERLKTDWEVLPADYIERLAKVKSGTYTRLDSGDRQAGASAQDMQKLLKETVMTADDEAGTLSLAYGNAALVSAIELAKDNVDLRARVAKLEALVSKLIEG